MARPPSDDPRVVIVRYRLTRDEAALLAQAAERAGVGTTDYAREKALAAARRQR